MTQDRRNLGWVAALTLAVTLGLPGAGWAQGAADLARATLSRVPQAVLNGAEGPIVMGVGNGDAVRWIAVNGAQRGVNPNTPNLFAALRSASPHQAEVIATHGADALRASSGLNPGDWIDTFEVQAGPIRLGGMEIHPDSSMRLRGALFSNDFELGDRWGQIVMWRGDTDYATDADWVDPANPFGGDMGMATRFAFSDDRMIWATGWPTLDMALSPSGASLATLPQVEALLSAVARAGNLGVAASVRIWLRNGAELPVTGAEAGPVEGLLMADAAARQSENAAMVLLLSPGTPTEGLEARLAEAWPILHDGPSDAAPEITVSGGDRPTITVTLRGDWGEDGAATNAAYLTLESALRTGRLGYLLSRR
ncbi:hypothetical protein roselon_03428 [Roseibacterium elongatum DSM 19469]|uniref:Uncharacterized protein n=1 Tax=Roseicyclus elongatus DSM 19469 TaxID=1294273 RepID=W8S9K2_9RHOB|nr:hypothetical protein [Roseibacterium elongatum]AHM05686.1 hypothetical protein roselon_03428 [Roseibacterium elongatum DSM 19469]